jgi:hypothetical protein
MVGVEALDEGGSRAFPPCVPSKLPETAVHFRQVLEGKLRQPVRQWEAWQAGFSTFSLSGLF